MADLQHIKCKNQWKTSANHQNFALYKKIRVRESKGCLNLHRKFINSHFYTCAVKMLLRMAVSATKCSTFEVQFGKSTLPKMTTIRHLGHL